MPHQKNSLYQKNIERLFALCNKDERWLILIMADPDAIASALALRRLLSHRVGEVAFAHINEIKRPDNLSMLAYLRVKMPLLSPAMLGKYDRFAVVDSQPSHHAEFEGISFSVVIDHHPPAEISGQQDNAMIDIRPKYGACSTILMEYLRTAGIRPGKMLATAMLYGIRVDTRNFTYKTIAADARAFRSLSKLADHEKLNRISRNEFFLPWVKPFSKALNSIQSIGSGKFIYFQNVPNSDLLVLTVDFLMRIHEVRWAAVAGLENGCLVVTLRSDGIRNVGKLAQRAFSDFGTAGGHHTMARAEIPLGKVPTEGPEKFVISRLRQALGRKKADDKPKKQDD